MQQIEDVIAKNVRPVLERHNGDLAVSSYKKGILKVKLLGNCAGCPSARLTTEEIVKKEILNAVEEVKEVELIQEVSEDMLELARKLLHEHSGSLAI
ncbi:MAG: NifU family protein [Eubacterium sp.]|nr:NifU family protein [Eubacterium sp.]